ncbi:type II toxin-antitoxin system VapC family toxin [Rhizobium tumorigenes]|uniref:Type II toxin-antitoxin system VapC family toxin n=1 Tax=Rhizobium tumorigenes TaxID=2041385 RepID=A0AAF1KVF8_9HYPH|nr:type II toxin-antitoxin system VapC family toxin [Rhizobium tumorigenes]WFR99330.1 type II toxin-antitoxin system VapC family toxin [Rhizobium tumorigenes]
MLAIDTNIIIRYLTRDHSEQSTKARAAVEDNDVFVATTVMLECEWVLRSVYSYQPQQVCAALRAFAGLRRVTLENPGLVARALERTEQGMDFADALHLGSIGGCEAMMTFDRRFIKAARAAGSDEVREP